MVGVLRLSPVLHPQTKRLLDNMTTRPQQTPRVLLHDWAMRGMIATGALDTDDGFYFSACHDEQAGRLNWASPGTMTLTAVNSPTFTADRGWSGDGVSQHLLVIAARTSLVKCTQNNAHVAAYNVASYAAGTTRMMVGGNNGVSMYLKALNAGGNAGARINDTTDISSASGVASSQNLVVGNRTASNARELFVNGASVNSNTTASTSTGMAGQLYLLRSDTTYDELDTVGFFSVGSSLSAFQISQRYLIGREWMRQVKAIP